VLFDVFRPQFSEASGAVLPITIEFEPRRKEYVPFYHNFVVPLVQPGDHFRTEPTYYTWDDAPETRKILCADRLAKVFKSGRGIRLTFDRPVVMIAPFKYGKQRTRIGLGVRGETEKIKAFDWPRKFLAVDDFVWNEGQCM
jgi:hypothetical protein